jgi:hypothetical protein
MRVTVARTFSMSMLSLDECRQILGLPDLTDDQVREIRDTLYGFAHTLIDEHLREKRRLRQIGLTHTGLEPLPTA